MTLSTSRQLLGTTGVPQARVSSHDHAGGSHTGATHLIVPDLRRVRSRSRGPGEGEVYGNVTNKVHRENSSTRTTVGTIRLILNFS